MKGLVALGRISHQKDIYQRDENGDRDWSGVTLVIQPGTTEDSLIGISDHEHGELHLHFGCTASLQAMAELHSVPDDFGTFKCDNLRFPSDSNVIGNPSSRIDVTSAKYNDDHTRSEIHVYVKP
ncbi:MAG: hypothetical protein QOC81_3191 [Thermoanaerobaculia bacterium]|jgi:hypothetical protein|nr:hypothetical protein [Thermoanaerobaculia bacterium]